MFEKNLTLPVGILAAYLDVPVFVFTSLVVHPIFAFLYLKLFLADF